MWRIISSISSPPKIWLARLVGNEGSWIPIITILTMMGMMNQKMAVNLVNHVNHLASFPHSLLRAIQKMAVLGRRYLCSLSHLKSFDVEDLATRKFSGSGGFFSATKKKTAEKSSLSRPKHPEKKPFERLIFPTIHCNPKKFKPFSHWPSKNPWMGWWPKMPKMGVKLIPSRFRNPANKHRLDV